MPAESNPCYKMVSVNFGDAPSDNPSFRVLLSYTCQFPVLQGIFTQIANFALFPSTVSVFTLKSTPEMEKNSACERMILTILNTV